MSTATMSRVLVVFLVICALSFIAGNYVIANSRQVDLSALSGVVVTPSGAFFLSFCARVCDCLSPLSQDDPCEKKLVQQRQQLVREANNANGL